MLHQHRHSIETHGSGTVRGAPHLRKFVPQWPHDRRALCVRLPEEGVQVRQQGIPLPQGVSVSAGVVFAKQPGFPPFGLQVTVTPEEGVVGAQLIPPHQKLAVSIPKEASHISTCMYTDSCCFSQHRCL